MQVLGIVGSMKKNGLTNTLVNMVIDEIKRLERDCGSTVIYTADQEIHPCRVICSDYCTSRACECSISDDLQCDLEHMLDADILILGAPLYFRAPPAGFHAFVERLVSLFFFQEMSGSDSQPSPLSGKPCGLIGVAEYSNPHQILEYLHDFCTILKMKPLVLRSFPYLGVAGQGDLTSPSIFHPYARSKELAHALLEEVTKK